MSQDVIFLSNVRLSFPHLVEPQKQVNPETGKERISYNGDFIMPADHPGYTQFMARYAALAGEKWKEHANTVMQMVHADRKSRCYGAGAERVNKKTFQPYDGYVGMMYITAGRDTPPQIIQADGSPIDPANTMAYQQLTRKMYGGCRVNVAVRPWLQDNKHGRGVRCDLIAVQFYQDDTPFGEGNVDASGMFGAVQTGGSVPGFMAQPAVAPAPAMPLPPFMQS
jgi:hypothetical protein